jgi:hypothetical protein
VRVTDCLRWRRLKAPSIESRLAVDLADSPNGHTAWNFNDTKSVLAFRVQYDGERLVFRKDNVAEGQYTGE